jgi:hypothetical protein
VLRTEVAGRGQVVLDQKESKLLGFELTSRDQDDPCEVHFGVQAGRRWRQLPHKMDVVYGSNRYASIVVQKYEFAEPK